MLNKKIEIKLLTQCQEHIPELAKIWYEEISRHWVPNSSIERARQNLIKHSNENKMPMTFVTLLEDKAVGMASLRENDGIRSDLIPWLGSLVVHPDYRNQKIGETLIESVKQQAIKFGYDKLYLLAFDKAIPTWYKKLGWKNIGTDNLFTYPVTVMDYDL